MGSCSSQDNTNNQNTVSEKEKSDQDKYRVALNRYLDLPTNFAPHIYIRSNLKKVLSLMKMYQDTPVKMYEYKSAKNVNLFFEHPFVVVKIREGIYIKIEWLRKGLNCYVVNNISSKWKKASWT